MNFLKSKFFQFCFSIGISLALIVWLYYTLDWKIVGNEMSKVHLWALLPVTAVSSLHYYLRALRWRYLLPKTEKDPAIKALLDSIMIGNFATYVLPLRAGEFIRPFLLTKFCSHSFSTTFASVVIERFFDLSAVLITFAIVLFFVEGIPAWVHSGALILSVLAIAIFLFIIVGSMAPHFVKKVAGFFLKFLPAKIAGFFDQFISDLLKAAEVLSDKKNIFLVVLLTILVWLSCYIIFYVYFWFFDIPALWNLAVACAVIIALAVAAPSAPGFIAVYQTACIASFALFNFSAEQAAAYSIVTHLYQYLIIMIYALYFFTTSNLKFSELKGRT